MKNQNGMKKQLNDKGLTLLELILALAMMFMFMLTIGSLNGFVIRNANFSAEEAKLQNQLEYALQDMELRLTESKRILDLPSCSPVQSTMIGTGGSPIGTCVAVETQSGERLVYRWQPNSTDQGQIVRSISPMVGNGTGKVDIITPNIVVPQAHLSGNLPFFSIVAGDDALVDSKLVSVRLAAQIKTLKDEVIKIDGTSRYFFLRGGETS